MLTPGEYSGVEKAKAMWEPVLQKMASFSGMTNYTIAFNEYTSYKHYFDVRLGPLCEEGEEEEEEEPGHSHEEKSGHSQGDEEEEGHSHELASSSAASTPQPTGHEHSHEHRSLERTIWKRHEGMSAPMGILSMDSRLLGKEHFNHPDFAKALKGAYPLVAEGVLRGHLIGGGKVLKPTEATSVHPAWRKCL